MVNNLNLVMEEYRLAIESSSDQKEQDKISKYFEELISKAFKQDEDELELQFQEDEKILLEERLKFEKDLKELEAAVDKEFEEKEDIFDIMLVDIDNLSREEFAKEYKLKDIKNLAKSLDLKSTGKEADIVDIIYTHFNK